VIALRPPPTGEAPVGTREARVLPKSNCIVPASGASVSERADAKRLTCGIPNDEAA